MVPGAANVKPISLPAESDRREIDLTFVFGSVWPVWRKVASQMPPTLSKTTLTSPLVAPQIPSMDMKKRCAPGPRGVWGVESSNIFSDRRGGAQDFVL